jgi:[protein-PII] uridylyltransferase
LLYLLTVGDSIATGPAAWSPAKAALVKDLFVKVAAAIERGEARALAADRRDALVDRMGADAAASFLARLPDSYLLAFDVDTMLRHAELLGAPTVRCEPGEGTNVVVTIVAADRPGLLATLAGALTVCGVNVLDAGLFGTTDGMALDVFSGTDPYGRVDDDGQQVTRTIRGALDGSIDLARLVDERRQSYRPPNRAPGPSTVEITNDESETDTVVEVHSDDDVGLLYRLASVFAELGLDVRVAKAATLGARVVDVFYVRDTDGRKVEDPDAVKALHAALVARLTE